MTTRHQIGGNNARAALGGDEDMLAAVIATFRKRTRPSAMLQGASRTPPVEVASVLTEYARLPSTWQCDCCGEPIEKAEDGRLEWIWSPLTQRAHGLQLVHTRAASPVSARPKALHLRLVDASDPAPSPSAELGCGHQARRPDDEILTIPLQHLTDADGLMQLLQLIGNGLLDQGKLLEIIQRIHLPLYEQARPHIDAAIKADRIRPNLAPGFHWQGDLAEVLKFAKIAAADRATAAAAPGKRCEGGSRTRVKTTLFSEHVDLLDIIAAVGEAGVRLQEALRHAYVMRPVKSELGQNIHGDRIKAMDLHAHQTFVDALRGCAAVGSVLSEESAEPIAFDRIDGARYVVAIDPLDGSDNLDAAVSVGSIFSVRPRNQRASAEGANFLGSSRSQVAAGYLLYGYCLQLVLTDGERVEWLALNPESDAFEVIESDMRAAQTPSILSINDCYQSFWPSWLQRYVVSVRARNLSSEEKTVSRFVGTLVADIHRNLLSGGMLIVPRDKRRPAGKLRLVYECAPMAMILVAAGAGAIDESGDIIDREACSFHERCGFIAGSRSELDAIRSLIADADTDGEVR